MSILKTKGGLASMAEENHPQNGDRYYHNDPYDLGPQTGGTLRSSSEALPLGESELPHAITAPPPVAAPPASVQHNNPAASVDAVITSEQAAKLPPQSYPSRKDSRRSVRPQGELVHHRDQGWAEYQPEVSPYGGGGASFRSPRGKDAFFDDYPEHDWYDYDYPRSRMMYPYRRRPTRDGRYPPGARVPPSHAGRPSIDQEPFIQKKHPRFDDGYQSDDGHNEYMYGGSTYAGGSHYGGPAAGGGGGREPPPNKPRSLRDLPHDEVLRLPWLMWMNSNAKNHFVAALGEFVGTTMFLFFAFSGTQVANVNSQAAEPNTSTGADTGFSPIVLLYISLVFAFSLMVNVWIFFRISGGLFNPAVTLAMLMTGAITVVRAALLVIAQICGAMFSSYIVSVLFPTSFNVRTTLSEGTSLVRGVFIEAILTAELVFTIIMLAKEKHKATFIAPVGIGLALFIGELVGVYYTGGSLNPARSFGPCVVTATFDEEHWIYWIGPGIGAIFAVGFYKFIKILEYEAANPGQDHSPDPADDEEKQMHEGSPARSVRSASARPTSKGSEKV